MDALTGQLQLEEIVIRYSETGGSSLGVRFFLKNLLSDWTNEHGQAARVQVRTEHSLYQHPRVVARWKSGETAESSLRNLTPKQIGELLNLYRDSHGPNLQLRHGGPRCWTNQRSIQGLWQPSLDLALKQITKATAVANGKKQAELNFSVPSIMLSKQHLTGKGGRWGADGQAFDVAWLRRTMISPLRRIPK
jgi:large subunit ribosomal protein L43